MAETEEDRDVELVDRARGGDTVAFEALVREHSPRLFAVIFRIVHKEEDARDALQQAWVRIWQGLQEFRGGARFSTWSYRIAVNQALDALRRKAVRPVEELDAERDDGRPRYDPAAPAGERPDRVAGRNEILERFMRLLGELTPEQRTVLALRELEGRSYEEIAAATGCRIGTVMSRLFYARAKLQQRMGDLR